MAHKALSLPEIVICLVRFLEFSDLVVVSQVSRLWHQVAAPCLPTNDFVWDDRPLRTNDELYRIQNRLLSSPFPRSMTCVFKSFGGKTIDITQRWREQQLERWRPILDPLISGQVQPFSLDSNHGHLETFVLPTLQNANRLHRLQLRGMSMGSELKDIVQQPKLQQTLKIFCLHGAGWAPYGFRTKLQFQWRRLDLDTVGITEKTLKRVLESSKDLRVLNVVDTIGYWDASLLKHLSTCNPALKVFRFSCKPKRGSISEDLEDAQLCLIMENLDLDLRTLGLYRLNVSANSWYQFQEKFASLTRLELLGKNHESCGPLVHWYLEKSARLEHLVTENVYIPMHLINETMSKWTCRGLRTLEVGFGPGPGALLATRDGSHVRAESRTLFAFLAHNVPLLERLLIRKRRVAATKEGGIGMLNDMRMLRFLHVESEEDDYEVGSLLPVLEKLAVRSDIEE